MRPPWQWPAPWHVVSALVVGSVGGAALLVYLLGHRSPLAELIDSYDPEVHALIPDPYLLEVLTVFDPDRELNRLRATRLQLLALGVHEDQLEPLIDPSLS